jgi:hypothetical protein
LELTKNQVENIIDTINKLEIDIVDKKGDYVSSQLQDRNIPKALSERKQEPTTKSFANDSIRM